jgi:hypothetical protein
VRYPPWSGVGQGTGGVVVTDLRMSVVQRERYWRLLAAAGVEPGDLSLPERQVLADLASCGERTCEGVCDVVTEARRVGFAEGEEATDRYEDGVPFFRHDATVTVTITAAELAERRMPDESVIGVAWADGDECIRRALAGASERASRPYDRGILLYKGWWLDCHTCSPTDRPAPQGTDRFTVGLVIEVAKVLTAHGYGPFEGGRPYVELQQHLLHYLHGEPDDRCTGRRLDGAR